MLWTFLDPLRGCGDVTQRCQRAALALVACAACAMGTPLALAQAPMPADLQIHLVRIPFGQLLRGIDDAGDLLAVGPYAEGFVHDASADVITLLRYPDEPTGNDIQPISLSTGGLALASEFVYEVHTKTFRATNLQPKSPGLYARITAMNNALQVAAMINPKNATGERGAYGTLSVGPAGSLVAPVDLQTFECPDHAQIRPEAINNLGQIVGICESLTRGTQTSGFLFDSRTGNFSLLRFPGAGETHPRGINDRGVVVGTLRVIPGQGGESSFVYDGQQFRTLPAPKDPHLVLLAQSINNAGQIAGTVHPLTAALGFVAVPSGQAVPRSAAQLDPERLRLLALEALRRVPDAPGLSGRAPGPGEADADPNFPPPGGNVRVALTSRMEVRYQYQRGSAQPLFDSGSHMQYLGFNEDGSWLRFGDDALIYTWNLAHKRLSLSTRPLPQVLHNSDPYRTLAANLPAFGDPMPAAPAHSQNSTNMAESAPGPNPAPDLARIVASVQPPQPAGFAPYGTAASITRQASGTYLLSYTLKYPGIPDSRIQVPVVRPGPNAPAAGLPVPSLPADSSGSWIWIGEGAKKDTAVFFSLESSGHLTWLFMPAAIGAMYLAPPSTGK